MRKWNWLILWFCVLFSGCSTVNHRISKQFDQYFQAPKRIAVMPLDVKIYQLTAGGVDEYMEESTMQAKKNITEAVYEELGSMPFVHLNAFDEAALSEEKKEYFWEQQGMFKAVAHSIIDHTYVPGTILQSKVENFDYTLGAEAQELGRITQAEALLFCVGRNYIWTAGRTALYIFATGMIGQNANAFVPAGNEYFLVSLVDAKTGDVLWFNVVPMPGDLRNEKIDKKLVKWMFKDFPAKLK